MNCIPLRSLRSSSSSSKRPSERRQHRRQQPNMEMSSAQHLPTSHSGMARPRRGLRGALYSVVFTLKNMFTLGKERNGAHECIDDRRNNNNHHGNCIVTGNNVNRRQYDKLRTHEEEDEGEALVVSAAPAASRGNGNVGDLAGANTPSDLLTSPDTFMDLAETDLDSDCSDDGGSSDCYEGFWDDESLTCNVCERAFSTPRLLERHQQKRRHWCCNTCDRLFDASIQLEQHKDQYEHWSDFDDEDGGGGGGAGDHDHDHDLMDEEELLNPEELERMFSQDLERWRKFLRIRRRLREAADAEQETSFGAEEGDRTMLLL